MSTGSENYLGVQSVSNLKVAHISTSFTNEIFTKLDLPIVAMHLTYKSALGYTQPPIQWVQRALSPGVKRQGRKADHSPLANAEVKKMCIYTSTLPYAFMA
jgi:hypothetical protein